MITSESVWNNCLKFIKDNIQIQAYKTWFEPIKPIKFEDNILSVQVPSKFFYEWLEEHYVKILKVALTQTHLLIHNSSHRTTCRWRKTFPCLRIM